MALTPEQLARRRAYRAWEKAMLDEAAKKRALFEAMERERVLKKQLEEPDEKEGASMPSSAFEYDTGGGIRVIRSTRNLGG
jgi:hypothetical protein